MEQRFAESGTRGDQRDVAAAASLAFLENVYFTLAEDRNRPGHRLEVVQEVDAIDPECRPNTVCLDAPRDVGQRCAVAKHRSRDPERRAPDRTARGIAVLQERIDHRRQIAVLERPERPHQHRARPYGRPVEQSEERFRTADVAREQHLLLTS